LAEAVIEVGKEVAKELGKEAAKKVAGKVVEKAKEERFLEKSLRKIGKTKIVRDITAKAFRSIKKRIFGKKKLLIIGGGEIATEISIAALKTELWNIRAIVGKDPLQKDEQASEVPKIPIANLLYYLDKPPKIAKVFTTIEEANPFVLFQFITGNLRNLGYITEYIVKEKPDVVLLEDMFLSPDEWIALSSTVSKELQGKKFVHFVPSPDEMCELSKLRYSDIFLNKSAMKDFLVQNVKSKNLLGVLDNQESDVVNLEELKVELEDIEHERRTPETTKQYCRIKEALRKYGKIILKPNTTSSGHGQFILSSWSQLETKYLSKRATESIKFVAEHRVRNEKYLIEKYLRNKTEACVVIARLRGKKRALVNRIYYSKYDMEKFNTGRLRDLTRLESSETRIGEDPLWTELSGIAREIFDNLSVPFLYVEFLLDNEHKDRYGKPRAFINEISYRPDDAGFITLISHKADQFSLFVESLEVLLKDGHKSKNEQEICIELVDTYKCETLNPEKAPRFYKNALFFDFPAQVSQNLVKLRLYEKYLAEPDGNIDYGRLIGYLWHHSSETDEMVREVLGALRKALDEKSMNLLKKSLEMISAPDKDKSIFREKKTIVVSDWEGPWVIADHAYEVVKAGIQKGDRLFAAISEYDDYLAYILKKEGYEPGDTLALIAPFLIAYNVDEKFLLEVAKKNANFITGARESIAAFQEAGYPFRIVSTSYCHYVYYTTSIAGISREDARCTEFPIDKYCFQIEDKDKKLVKEKVSEIINLRKLGISASSTEKDLPIEARKVIKTMDNFFWSELPKTSFGPFLSSVKPLGGRRKFNALLEMLKKENRSLERTVVIGDSITDWVMLRRTRNEGGLAISFNGNAYAVGNANVAVISDNCMIMPVLVELFENVGIKGIERIAKNWSLKTLQNEVAKGHLSQSLFERFSKLSADARRYDVYWVTEENVESIIELSTAFRKTVRGSAVGALG